MSSGLFNAEKLLQYTKLAPAWNRNAGVAIIERLYAGVRLGFMNNFPSRRKNGRRFRAMYERPEIKSRDIGESEE